MRVNTDGYNTYLNLKDDYGNIENQMNFIIAQSGWGKGLATAGLAETLHNEGYQVIVIADPKDESEFAYSMFKPEKAYHLEMLERMGVKPDKMSVKLYHPFTFNLPRTKIPEMNIFTLPLKDMVENEFLFIAQSEYQTETVKLLIRASRNLSDSGGLYQFIHNIQDLIKGKKKGKTYKADPNNFYLEGSAGTQKALTQISTSLKPFEQHYYLSSKNNPLNLNWKEFLSDKDSYHVFVYNYLPYDPNMMVRDFLVLQLISQIVSHSHPTKKLRKHPLAIILPEIGSQMPIRPEGHKKFLAKPLTKFLSTCRSIGEGGITTISDSQTYSGIDEEYANRSTVVFLGKLAGMRDLEKVVKSLGLKQDMRKRLMHPEYRNSYTLVGDETEHEVFIRFPSHMWAEPEYSFDKMYLKYFRNKMQSYHPIMDMMSKDLEVEKKKFKELAKKKADDLEEEEVKVEKKKDKKEKESQAKEKESINKSDEKSKEKIIMLMGKDKEENPDIGLRELARKYQINHITVKRYLETYQAQVDDKDYEDKFLEEDAK